MLKSLLVLTHTTMEAICLVTFVEVHKNRVYLASHGLLILN